MQTSNGHSLSYKPTYLPYDLKVTQVATCYTYCLCTLPQNTKYCFDSINSSWRIAKHSKKVTMKSSSLPYLKFSNHWDCITEPRDKLCKWDTAPHDSKKAQLTILRCTYLRLTPEWSEHVLERTHLSFKGSTFSPPPLDFCLSSLPSASAPSQPTAHRLEEERQEKHRAPESKIHSTGQHKTRTREQE